MVLPIVAYGYPVLNKVAKDIDANYPDLQQLIDNMFETMYNANGVGLAAPQIGLGIRIFVIDSEQLFQDDEEEDSKASKTTNDDEEQETGLKQAFINARIVQKGGKTWPYSEGCLSIPHIHEDVMRPEKIRIQYYDRNFELHDEIFDGITARVILHEYDHVEGILFTSYLSNLKRRLLKRKLERISKGLVNVDYPMRFPIKKRR
ncbi:MAG: peptide deformylase [Chitinophagales bacterium]